MLLRLSFKLVFKNPKHAKLLKENLYMVLFSRTSDHFELLFVFLDLLYPHSQNCSKIALLAANSETQVFWIVTRNFTS